MKVGSENGVVLAADYTQDDHEILIKIVKECQRQNAEGSFGSWKQYLLSHVDHKANAGPTDPAKRSWQVLAGFADSLTAAEDTEMVARMREWQACKRSTDGLEQAEPWPPTPEQELVLRTRRNASYQRNYDFPSYRKGWVCTERGAPCGGRAAEVLVGLDCEMCVCEEQVRELVRVAAVDRSCMVLLSSLVKPERPVVDYKSAITGVGPAALKAVTFTQVQAQRAVLDLLPPGAILVGHGLHHDLRALKIDHTRVIDTSLLFQYRGLAGAVPSLSDLCQAVLRQGIRAGGPAHDSVEDALAPMRLALHELEHGPSAPLPVPPTQVEATELAKLFIHRIPRGTLPADLVPIFGSAGVPHVQTIKWGAGSLGSTLAVFLTAESANQAFKALRGAQTRDSLGRAQKAVALGAALVSVRKNGCHNGLQFGADARKGREDEGAPHAKRLRAEGAAEGRGAEKGPGPPGTGQGAEAGSRGEDGSHGVASMAVRAAGPLEEEQQARQDAAGPSGSHPLTGAKALKRLRRKLRRQNAAAGGDTGVAAAEPGGESGGDARGKGPSQQGAGSPAAGAPPAGGALHPKGRRGVGLAGAAHPEASEVPAAQVEVGVLRRQLEERNAEVAALQRLVTELARRQARP